MKQTKQFLRPLLMAIVMMAGMLVPQGAWAQELWVEDETRTISSNESYESIEVHPGGVLIINEGVTLTVTSYLYIHDYPHGFGTVINYGTIIGEGSINMDGGVLANHGHIDLGGADGYGTFYNTGTLGDGYFNLTTTPCDHDYEDFTVDATCTHGAGTQYRCYTCYYMWLDETSGALPHNIDSHNGMNICSSCGHTTYDEPAYGDGSEEDPYQIANAGNLYWFADYTRNEDNYANAILTADIVLNDGTFAADGTFTATGADEPSKPFPWICIGGVNGSYGGTFDGNGHTISGMYVNDSFGLFYDLSGSVVNLGIVNCYIRADDYTGAICHWNKGTISNCYTTGILSGSYSSGICDTNTDIYSTISNCYSTCTFVYDTNFYGGGICGTNSGTISNCYTSDNTTIQHNNKTASEVYGGVSANRFASGEIAYKLNGSVDGEGSWTAGATDGTQAWYQKLGENGDSYPVLAAAEGNTVYYGYENCLSESETYSNDLRYAEKIDSHDYQVQNVVWSDYYTTATLQLVCSRDAEHTANVEVTDEGITSEDTTPATCTTAGVRTYTAKATYAGVEYTGTKEVEIPALGHQFGEDHICTVCHQPAAIAHAGTSGTCTWTIYENGDMIFAPTEGETGTLGEWNWDSSPWFAYRSEIKSVKFQGEVLASSCWYMFYDCSNLTTIDFSGFNTANVWDMAHMFQSCTSLQSLDLSSFNTANLQDMEYMFSGCSALQSVDLSSFNTTNVGRMACMFEMCQNLATLKLSNDFVLNEGVDKENLFGDCATNTGQLLIYYVIDESIKEALQKGTTWSGYFWDAEFVPSAIVKDGVPFNSTNEWGCNVPAEDVVFTRTFTAEKPASAMLPFTVAASQISGATFYEFKGVKYENNEWVADMTEVTTVSEYTPYVVITSGTGITFTGDNIMFQSTEVVNGNMTQTDPETGWTFVALNEFKRWEAGDEEIGKAYGFAGKNKDYDDYSVAKGEFVKIAAGASAKPGRCYLVKNDGEPLAAKGMTRASAADELPSTIKVRFISGSANGIGTLNTETGEFSIEGWYDLNGNKIEQPSKGGVYINNNKKVMVK